MGGNVKIGLKHVLSGCAIWCAAVIMGLTLPFVLTGTPETIKEQAVCSITKTVCEAVKNACDICWASDPCTDVFRLHEKLKCSAILLIHQQDTSRWSDAPA